MTERITTYGPCCRCQHMAHHILVLRGRRVVVHLDSAVQPCPIRPGEMPEVGKPQEITKPAR